MPSGFMLESGFFFCLWFQAPADCMRVWSLPKSFPHLWKKLWKIHDISRSTLFLAEFPRLLTQAKARTRGRLRFPDDLRA